VQRWKKGLALPVTLAAVALGILISLQVETQKNVSAAEKINQERLSRLKNVVANAQAENNRLRKEQQELAAKLDQARKQGGADPTVLAQLDQIGIMDGTRKVQGQGIQILIDDRQQERKIVWPLTVDNLVEIVNVLRFAGAEAISINGQRIVGSTSIVNSGTTTILVNQMPIKRAEGVPYEINVIGNPDTLNDYFTNLVGASLKQSGGMQVSVTRKVVQIPSYKGSYNFRVATPATNP